MLNKLFNCLIANCYS